MKWIKQDDTTSIFFGCHFIQVTVTQDGDKPDMTCTKYIKTLCGGGRPPVVHTGTGGGGGWGLEGLEVEPLRRALLLLVQDVFLGLLEIFVCDFHAPLAQSHEAGFCADGLRTERTVYYSSRRLFQPIDPAFTIFNIFHANIAHSNIKGESTEAPS